MPRKKAITDLETRIDHFYEVHSAKRVTLAAFLVGIVSIGVAWVTYYFTLNAFLVIGAFAGSSLLAVNVAMFGIVPPTMRLADSKAFILGALKEPLRIKSVGKKRVQLQDSKGRVRTLNGFERVLWKTIVTPYFIEMNSGAGITPSGKPAETGLTNSEKKVLEKRQAELWAKEKELSAEGEKLRLERENLVARGRELKKAENLHLDRMSRVELAEAELAKLRVDVERSAAENKNAEVAAADAQLVKEKEDALKVKEEELESFKLRLVEDREQMEAQQAKLERMQGALLREQAASGGSAATGKERDLEERAIELDERMRYVADVENDLIERLNQLSEREASVEQTEVEAGLRHD